MKKLSKSQISLIDTLESLIRSDYFQNLISKESIPPEFSELVLKKLETGLTLQTVKLKSPPIEDFNLEEKELLLLLTQRIGNLNYPSDLLIIKTTKDDFLNLLAKKLRPGGLLHIATDWQPYADWIAERLDQVPEFSGGVVSRPANRTFTRFEKQGLDKEHQVTDFHYFKK